MKSVKLVVLAFVIVLTGQAQINPFIHVDQFGYKTDAPKVAVLSSPEFGYNSDMDYSPSSSLTLKSAATDDVVWVGDIMTWNGGATHSSSGDKGWWLDFSDFETPGSYYVYDELNDESSAVFTISNNPYAEVMRQAGRMYFYNRCNFPKEAPYAEANWTDENNFNNPGQDFNCRYIFDQENEALEKDLSGGWFDAGDYNKYVTFAVSAVHNLLSAYETNPEAFGDDWNIPESGNGIPDILDEVKWELDWCRKMINEDGSVHLKMGSRNYSENANSPPSENYDGRYYGPTCTSASAAIASMFSHAALVYEQVPVLASYADLLIEEAILCYEYTLPFLDSESLQTDCDDGSIVAGDADLSEDDQLKLLLQAAVYFHDFNTSSVYNDFFMDHYQSTSLMENDYWEYNELILIDAYLRYSELPTSNVLINFYMLNSVEENVTNNWEDYFGFSEADLYRAFVPDYSYSWGSNQSLANAGNLNALLASLEIGDDSEDQLLKTSEQLHYFHGVNPLGMVYMSNMYVYGAEHCANEIYHTWFWDGTVYDHALTSANGPAPGFVPGGANQWYGVEEYSPPYNQTPMKSYLDFNDPWPAESYSISEPAIYYQAAYIRLLSHFVSGDEIIGIDDIEKDHGIEIYPNPASDLLTIALSSEFESICVYNAIGDQMLKDIVTSARITINTSDYPAGVYFIQLENANLEKYNYKVVVR